MFKKTLERGFTLIELLVVIAIIGILAAVVLASLNDARSSGANASVKQQMASMRAQAEIAYNENGFSYAGVCLATGKLNSLLVGVQSQSPATSINRVLTTAGSATTVTCHDTALGWAVSAPLQGGGYWCVDSTGTSAQKTGVLAASAIICPAT